MYVRIPASPDTFCPKCQATNHDRAVSVWEVADATGHHWECDVCSLMWLGPNLDRRDLKGRRIG